MSQLKPVVFAAECEDCPDCGEPVCPQFITCPGPCQEDEYEYVELEGVLYAKTHG